MPTTVTPITPAQHAFARVAALFDDYRAHHGHPPSPQRTHAWLRDQIAQHRLAVAAATRAGEVCGFVTTAVTPAPLLLGTAWSIGDLYVAPSARRNGVARALLRHVVDEARAAGAHRVSLRTEAGNIPARALYAAVGFRPVTGLELLNLTLGSE
ncbi:GNAT family N-acetyltransferase [Micromonospora terminaliae]|uniref:GNAT family N-acetyltransferase n=1 Tax=Micromonospora terminaliae TaxID=1914461 RepID=A0AAJ2ZHV9_9ACTN|nr:GNAT family N-acetyltransferase [Micromonospora terminaliae]NES29921.1 GNAT family N-acetyltransferase [Micromonospora terminaliae]QGL46899.1 GNAT family N-acetyltransferase [Micromonospora terminaliae]